MVVVKVGAVKGGGGQVVEEVALQGVSFSFISIDNF